VTLSQKNAAGALYKTLCQNFQLTLCNKYLCVKYSFYYLRERCLSKGTIESALGVDESGQECSCKTAP